MSDCVILILGVICAGAGGEMFVRGAVGLARWARVSPGMIGATVAAFATSSPELSVAVSSAMAGQPQITLGDSLGSNVANIALILGGALLISGIRSPRDSVRRDFPMALLTPVVTGVLLLDGEVSRLDGAFLLVIFFTWFGVAAMEARKQRSAAAEVLGRDRRWSTVAVLVVGLGFLITAGKLIVTGATGIAITFGMDAFVIGATIVAVGTSVPELATTVIAKLRGHDEVGLGTILGSNIFNGLFIVSVAALIHPIAVGWREVTVTLMFGLIAPVIAYPSRGGMIGRWRGSVLLMVYALYLVAILHRQVS